MFTAKAFNAGAMNAVVNGEWRFPEKMPTRKICSTGILWEDFC
jgi:hypothetical protein